MQLISTLVLFLICGLYSPFDGCGWYSGLCHVFSCSMFAISEGWHYYMVSFMFQRPRFIPYGCFDPCRHIQIRSIWLQADMSSWYMYSTLLLGNRAESGLILLCRTNKRPTVLALSATTRAQVAKSHPKQLWGAAESGFCKQRGILLYLSL